MDDLEEYRQECPACAAGETHEHQRMPIFALPRNKNYARRTDWDAAGLAFTPPEGAAP